VIQQWALWFRRLPALALVQAVRFYQLVISPWYPPSCRFYPTCSQYAIDALRIGGVVRGSWWALRRLARCHPWNPGGVDHVDPAKGRLAEVADDLARELAFFAAAPAVVPTADRQSAA
jgi:uncharacterized protein